VADREIRLYGDSILRQRAKDILSIGEEERKILEHMLLVMRKAGGIGLSAPQIGLSVRLIVVEYNDSLLMLGNPKILKKEDFDILEEGCLSFPEITVRIKRPKRIVIEALNKENKKIRLQADEILSRALQHEIDHLNGKLIIDYATLIDKFKIRKKMKDLQRKTKYDRLQK
jgi:peptide deformylase